MFREPVKPSNPADGDLAAVLDGGGLPGLEALAPKLPAFMALWLEEILRERLPAEVMLTVAGKLAEGGLTASALSVLARVQAAMQTPADQGKILEIRAAVERQAGMYWAAAADARGAARLMGRMPSGEGPPDLEEGAFWVVNAANDPQAYHALLAALAAAPLADDPLRGPLAKRLAMDPAFQRAHVPLTQDFSFLVVGEEGPILQVECDVLGMRFMACREVGVVLTPLAADPPPAAQALAIRQLRLNAEWSGTREIQVDAAAPAALPAALKSWLEECPHAAHAEIREAWIDLALDPDEIFRAYREAHRQSVRWGMAHLAVASSRDTSMDCAQVYCDLHAQEGRTPSFERDQLNMMLGEGWLTAYVGALEGEPVSVLLAARHGHTTYYMASINKRMETKPISHVLLHQAILDARAEGLRRFHLGMLSTGTNFSRKLQNIAFYKSGFTKTFEDRIAYWMPV